MSTRKPKPRAIPPGDVEKFIKEYKPRQLRRKSSLEPHFDLVRKLREKGLTPKAVFDRLTLSGVKTSYHIVYRAIESIEGRGASGVDIEKSPLAPYLDTVRALRERGFSVRECHEYLATRGVKASYHSVYRVARALPSPA